MLLHSTERRLYHTNAADRAFSQSVVNLFADKGNVIAHRHGVEIIVHTLVLVLELGQTFLLVGEQRIS